MENKLTKERIDRHLEYDWYKYFLLVIFSVAIWLTVFSMSSGLPEYKIFTVLCIDSEASNIVTTAFDENKSEIFGEDSAIEKITFETVSVDNMTLGTYMATRGLLSDIIIAPYDVFATYSEMGFFLELESAVEQGYLTNENLQSMTEDTFFVQVPSEELLEQNPDSEFSEPKRTGIILNSLGKDLFVSYKQDAEGEDIVYVLGITGGNLSSSSGGGNKGLFNGLKQDSERAEVFSFMKYMFFEGEYINYRNAI